MNKNKTLYVTLFLFMLSPLFSFQFQPITMDFQDTGSGSTKTFICSNDSSERIALKISLFARFIDDRGNEILTPAEKDFLVFPERMILEPESSQNLRIQYRGASLDGKEKAYRIYVEQVPVEFEKSTNTGLKILFRYIGSFYIIPETFRQQIELKNLAYMDHEEGPKLEIRIGNSGNTHIIIQNIKLTLTGQEGSVTLSNDQLQELSDINLLSQGERVCLIPWPENFSKQQLQGAITYDGIR